MENFKKFLYEIVEEKNNDDYENDEEVRCGFCAKLVNLSRAYIKDEDYKIFCSKRCYLKQLNSNYF